MSATLSRQNRIFVLDVFMIAILAEKSAISFATIAVFLEFRWIGPIVAKKIRDFSATIYGCYLPPVMMPDILGRNLLSGQYVRVPAAIINAISAR